MSWASRRRATYGMGVFLFFFILIGAPLAYWYLTIPATCEDGIRNQGETSPDRGGPCLRLDGKALSPASILWARSFRVRDGSYNAVAYIQNANEGAGIQKVAYRFALYDTDNVLVAERAGETFVMPESITPVFEKGIQTGSRAAVHTYFIYTDPLSWSRMEDRSKIVVVNDKEIFDASLAPRITATALNTSVKDMTNVVFVATVFDPAGNAFAASQTTIPKLKAGVKQVITFTWPDAFNISVGRVDIIPLVEPAVSK